MHQTAPWWPHLFSWPRIFDPVSWWWLSVKGYALTSSWFNVAWIVIGVTYLRRHNCHVRRCWRLQWHADPQTGHPLCRRHHPDPHGYLSASRDGASPTGLAERPPTPHDGPTGLGT